MNIEELQKRNKILERRWKIVLVLAVLFVLTRPVALYVAKKIYTCEQGNYSYINKSIVCEEPVIKKTGYAETQAKITSFINQEISAGRLSEGAVYFRDLENGPVWGINELADFAPASLLKLPTALVYMFMAESNPHILQEKLIAEGQPENINQIFTPSETAQVGQEYVIDDLLGRMLKYSDNNSYITLYKHMFNIGQGNVVHDIFLELGIIAPNDAFDEVVSVRRYASIYTALYNGSLVNLDYSEKILNWLVEADFRRGLEQGVSEKIKVAHKFGERFSPDGSKQLHDCGIIYYPSNPYLLCVMTRGSDFEELVNVISQISKEVYAEVDSRKF
jgi:hypothetical protein